jgi:hypothetical protein
MEEDLQGPDEQLNLDVFHEADFDAYAPCKWNSNMFTLERRRVKTKLEGLGRSLDEILSSEGLQLTMHSSDEFPSFWNKKKVDSQWLFFSRSEAAKEELSHLVDQERTLAETLADPTPLYRHLFLGVSVNESHLEIGLRLHHDAWVDRKNFLNLLANPESAEKLRALIAPLPGHFHISTDEANLQTLEDFEPEHLSDLVGAFDNEKGWLFIGARLPRDQVLVLEGDISDTAKEVFQSLIPVYKTIAWSPANDAISMEQVVKERNEALQKSHEELDRERAEREAMLREKEAKGLELKREIEDKIRETEAWRSREVAARRAAAAREKIAAKESDARAQAEALAAKWGLGGKGKTASSSERQKRASPAPDKNRPVSERPPKAREPRVGVGEIAVGASVVVTKGFLKGRRGKIQEIDEKGGLKVGFGVLSSRLEADEVKPLDPKRAGREETSAARRQSSSKHRPNRPSHRFRDTLQED